MFSNVNLWVYEQKKTKQHLSPHFSKSSFESVQVPVLV